MTCFPCFGRKKVALAPPKLQTIDIDEEFSRAHNIELYTYRELSVATENFSPAMKIGQGGFGSVYKGVLKNGTMVAVKVLSAESRQGVKEFVTEVIAISNINHENLVKLYGCCVEGSHRIIVYGYLENNSLARTLLDEGNYSIEFDWKRRKMICLGVAKGLTFLHEEVRPHIVHRDIKASNVLLDRDLTPKISDFGLAKLFPDNETHISTCVAGTMGYLAPEYALQGHLTRKADIYSFGVLVLEIVSGRCNTNKRLPIGEQKLLERAWKMYEKGTLSRLVDTSLEMETDIDEARNFMKIALLCTQDRSKLRPSMSKVLKMMNGEIEIDMDISKPSLFPENGLKSQSYTSSLSKKEGESSSSGNSDANTDTSHATMTFSTMYDRSL